MPSRNDKRSVANKTLLAWIIGTLTSSMSSSFAYSLETEEPITVNKIRTPQPWVRFSTDYIRCFCNFPQCISTGYMCKSNAGGCFSKFLEHVGHHSRDYRGRHGCLELLTYNENRALCERGKREEANGHKKKSLDFCCYYDMCNHVDSPEIKDLINNTLFNEPQTSDTVGNIQQPVDYTNSQVWFRAATIAVPVCGAVILFVLIALAVKILQSENQNTLDQKLGSPFYERHVCSQSRHSCDKGERSYDILRKPQDYNCLHDYEAEDLQRIQVPLLIQNEIGIHHAGNKNGMKTKLNLTHVESVANDYKDCSKSVVLDIEKISNKRSKNNLVNHVNNDKHLDIKYANDKIFVNSVIQ